METSDPPGIDGVRRLAVGVLVAVPAADPLVAAGAERPHPVAGRGSVSGEQHAAHIRRHAGVVEGAVELVNGVGAKGVADLRAVEGDAHRPLIDGAVIRDVGEVEPLHGRPGGGVEELADHEPMLAE